MGVGERGGMIRHIVMFSAKDRNDVDVIHDALWRLADIPGASRFEVARNGRMDQIANDIDVIVYAEFPDRGALAAYKAHPLYQEAIAVVRPLRDMRVAADYEVPER